jgi:hypothetical protein
LDGQLLPQQISKKGNGGRGSVGHCTGCIEIGALEKAERRRAPGEGRDLANATGSGASTLWRARFWWSPWCDHGRHWRP